jgi:hypothetical protein
VAISGNQWAQFRCKQRIVPVADDEDRNQWQSVASSGKQRIVPVADDED